MTADKPTPNGAPKDVPQTSAIVPQVEQKLETAIQDLPQPKQKQIREIIQETFMAFISASAGPKIDPETARIIVGSADKDNENKFKYLIQKQKDAAAENERGHQLETERYRGRMELAKPLLYVSLLLIVGCTASGIYLAVIGHETLGASVLTGIFGSVFGYLGGLGTANFFKNK